MKSTTKQTEAQPQQLQLTVEDYEADARWFRPPVNSLASERNFNVDFSVDFSLD